MKLISKKLEIKYEKADVKEPERPAELMCYIQDAQCIKKPRPAIIICPGGGYCYTSPREAECVAMQYLAAGMQAFVLYYSCAPAVFPTSLLELAASVALVREKAREWNIDSDKIFVGGFSAGGHLAASLGCFWKEGFICDALDVNPEQIRPNGNILCYPVITSGEYAHRGSFDALCNGLDQNKFLELTSLELQAGEQNPPTFIWHTAEDNAVPVENSFLYVNALRRAGVSVEFHMFAHGWHGLSLANDETIDNNSKPVPKVQEWMKLSLIWINDLGNDY